MVRSVVVPLDGSRFSEAALPVAARLARSAGARLTLVMVHEPTMAFVPAADIPAPVPPDDAELRAHEREYLVDTARHLGRIGPHEVSHELLDGIAATALVDAIDRERPDLVVMSTHGRGPLSRFWLGSVADHLIRHVTVPILLLRPRDGDVVPPELPKVRTVLVALDLSAAAEGIFGPLISFARVTQAHVTLLHVIEPVLGISNAVPPYPVAVPHDLLERTRADAQKRLDRLADRLRDSGVGVATRVVVGMGVAGTVLRQAAEGGFDCVAMTTHGAGGVARMLMGSVADKVIRGTDRPVLIYRAAGDAPA
jgi:nucleotide-binding universal stress UspA family protein